MNTEAKKRAVAQAAVEAISDHLVADAAIGVGTGSTAAYFIDALAPLAGRFAGAVASSEASARHLAEQGIRVMKLQEVDALPVYVDGADQARSDLMLIKGGGGALTREKIVAAASEEFLCIVDDTKLVRRLGAHPVPVEVIPMATTLVTRTLTALGGQASLREGFRTDNGNAIVDVDGLDLSRPADMESSLNDVVGSVCNGLFARRSADRLLVASDRGVDERRR